MTPALNTRNATNDHVRNVHSMTPEPETQSTCKIVVYILIFFMGGGFIGEA